MEDADVLFEEEAKEETEIEEIQMKGSRLQCFCATIVEN